MKLNSSRNVTFEYALLNSIHPFAPLDQRLHDNAKKLEHQLNVITGFAQRYNQTLVHKENMLA
jgi:hypothetical protein